MKKPAGPKPAKPAPSGFDIGLVDALAKVVARYDLSEIEIGGDGVHVRVARERMIAAAPAPLAVAAPPAPAPAAEAMALPAAAASENPADHPGAVKSPMVGTAYLRASPEAKAFVEVGTTVKTGDKIMLIEAMKTFNEILAPRPGRVSLIFVDDGVPVEFDQPLMVIE
jgi:acetyl-CoA carboxylase biotin carboxyl carrier protein